MTIIKQRIRCERCSKIFSLDCVKKVIVYYLDKNVENIQILCRKCLVELKKSKIHLITTPKREKVTYQWINS